MKNIAEVYKIVYTQLEGMSEFKFSENRIKVQNDVVAKTTLDVFEDKIRISLNFPSKPTGNKAVDLCTFSDQIQNALSYHINRPVEGTFGVNHTDGSYTLHFLVHWTKDIINPTIPDLKKVVVSAQNWRWNETHVSDYFGIVLNFVLNFKQYPEVFKGLDLKWKDNVITYNDTMLLKINILEKNDKDGTYNFHATVGDQFSCFLTKTITDIYGLTHTTNIKYCDNNGDSNLTGSIKDDRYWQLIARIPNDVSGIQYREAFMGDWSIFVKPIEGYNKFQEEQHTDDSNNHVSTKGLEAAKEVLELLETNYINENQLIDKFIALDNLLNSTYIKDWQNTNEYNPIEHQYYSKINFIDVFKRLRLEVIDLVIPVEYKNKFLDKTFDPDLTDSINFLKECLDQLKLDSMMVVIMSQLFYSLRRGN